MKADAVAPASAAQRLVPVLENVPIARDTYRLRLGDPTLARAIRPGQFVMIRPGPEGADDPLLGRPFALYDVFTDGREQPIGVDVVYQVVGRGTAALAQRRPGDRLVTLGTTGQRVWTTPGRPGHLRRRRHRPDAVSGAGPMVAGQDEIRPGTTGSGPDSSELGY